MAEKFYKLTSPQKNIWTQENFFEGTTINNICASITILDSLNEDALKKALYYIVENNDSFRIKIVLDNNVPVQYFSEFKEFNIETIYLKHDDEFEKIKSNLMNYKFNLLDSDLFCFKILKYPDGHGMLLFTVHHIISDGWSLGIFAQNIMKKYCDFCNIQTPILPDIHQYREYIEKESEYLNSQKFEKDKIYWNELFKTFPESISFTGNKDTLNNKNFCSKRKSFRVPISVAQNIQKYCMQNKISAFHFFMSVYSIYLAKTTGKTEFVIRNSNIKSYKFQRKKYNGNVY